MQNPLNSWNIPDGPWERIHIDFAGPFEGYMWFLVIDAYSRWVEVFPIKHATTECVMKILNALFARYGICKQIVSDNGAQFTSHEFKAYCRSYNV